MRFYLSPNCHLKRLETPCVYDTQTDELYELDQSAFSFLAECARPEGAKTEPGEFTDFCLEEGILTQEPQETERPPLEQAPSPSLRYLELQLTLRCNLRCRHCYIGPQGRQELTINEVRTILSQFEKMQGLRLLLTGGEPLMHPEFDSINKILPEFGIRRILFTNGLLATKKRLESLNVHEIQVSVDGLEDSHDALRGRGSFKKAIECLNSAIDIGLEASVSTMVHAKNLDDFDKMDRMFRDMGVRDWTVDIPCSEGRLKDNPAFAIPPEEGGRFLEYGFGEGLHGGGTGHACGLHLMSVMADGSCARCAFYANRSVGHSSEGLAECWSRIRPIKLEELSCDCKHIDACRGGCRYRAETLGDPMGKDRYRCILYGKE